MSRTCYPDGIARKIELYEEKSLFAYVKTKVQISCAVTAQLISTFVLAAQIVQFLFLNLQFQAASPVLWLYRPVCISPIWKP